MKNFLPFPKIENLNIILYLFILSLTIRITAIFLYHGLSDAPNFGADDSEYLALAHSIRFESIFSYGAEHPWGQTLPIDGPGPFMPTAARAPLYPFLISFLWWGKQPPIFQIYLLQAILGSIVAIIIFKIASKVAGDKIGIIAGLITALYPLNIYLCTVVLTETLFTFLLVTSIYLWTRNKASASGIFLGLACLTRPIILPFLILMFGASIFSKFNRKTHFKIFLAAFLIVFPWSVRNTIVMHSVIPVASSGWGANLLFGTIDLPYGEGNNFWFNFAADKQVQEIITSTDNETNAEIRMLHAGIDRILQNPVKWLSHRFIQYPRLFADTGMYMLKIFPLSVAFIKVCMLAISFIFSIFCFLGVLLSYSTIRQFYTILAFPVLFCVMQFPAYGEPRFIAPILPLLSIFVALTISRLINISRAQF